MIKNLSSKQTFFVKFVIPILVVALLIFVVVMGLTAGNGSHRTFGVLFSSAMGWWFLMTLGFAAYLIWWSLVRLKRVGIDDRFLYISDYSKEVKVPLEDVEDVTEILWSKYHPVTIRFKWGSEFGPDVVFIPKVRWSNYWSSHPVVDEILEAVRRAKSTS